MTVKRSTHDIAKIVSGILHGEDVFITGDVVTDSREANPGSLYVARSGENADGADFIDQAVANGAVAALVQRPVPTAPCPTIVVEDATYALGELARVHLAALRESGSIDVIAVTGSAGKTTTKDLLAQVLAAQAPTVAPKLSFNNEVGLPLTVLKATGTTRYLVLEMGASGPGHIDYLTRIAPLDIGVVLMVGRAHLGGFGTTISDVARAKAELVHGVKPAGTVILNQDDFLVAQMREESPARVLTFAVKNQDDNAAATADVQANNVVDAGNAHAAFSLQIGAQSTPVCLELVGMHHVTNALAAAAVCHTLGMDLTSIAAGLCSAGAASPHRMDVRKVGSDVLLIDDSYNANPDSMKAALQSLSTLAGARRRVAVLGEMLELGAGGEDIHREVGENIVSAGVGLLLTVGAGAEALGKSGRSGAAIHHCEDIAQARTRLGELLRPGDAVLLKGSNGSHVWRLADEMIGGEIVP